MGITPAEAAGLGVAIYKVGMPWPLEPSGHPRLRRRPRDPDGHRAQAPADRGPGPRRALRPAGPRPADGSSARPTRRGAAAAVASWPRCRWPRSRWRSPTACRPAPHMDRVYDYLDRVSAASMAAVTLAADQQRKPFFCSGCPHNTSTRLPEGSRALAGIGCHYMASFTDPNTDLTSHMGGEGLTWVGAVALHRREARLRQPGRRHLQPLRLAGDPRRGRGQGRT